MVYLLKFLSVSFFLSPSLVNIFICYQAYVFSIFILIKALVINKVRKFRRLTKTELCTYQMLFYV